MLYQAQIRHINGDIITTICDDNKERFIREVKRAKENLSEYLNGQYNNEEIFIVFV